MRKIRKQKLFSSSSSEDEMPTKLHSPPIRSLTPKATNLLPSLADHIVEGVHHQNPSNMLRGSEIQNEDGNFSQGKVIFFTINV